MAGANGSDTRRRIEAQLIRLVARYGYPDLRLEELFRASGVDRDQFALHFDGLDDCFMETWARIDQERRELSLVALEEGTDWRSSLRAALLAGLRFLAADPERARFYAIEVVSIPESHAEPREEAVKRIREAIAAGDPRAERPEIMATALADGIAGGIWMRIATLIGEGRAADLPDHLPQLMYSVVLPYYGRAVADEELSRK
jgi:AcrR family transcriptional regulator